MKKLNVTPITNSTRFHPKKGTLEFLQLAHIEGFAALMKALIGPSYNAADIYVLYGGENSGTYPAYNITEGVAFHNGEIRYFDAASFTATGSDVAICNLLTEQYTTDADPVTLSDLSVVNMHDIRKLQIVAGASGSGVLDYSAFTRPSFIAKLPIAITAPTAAPYADNILQLIGALPNLGLYVPAPNQAHEIMHAGEMTFGDIAGGSGGSITITFGVTLDTDQYYVSGTWVHNGGDLTANPTAVWIVESRGTTSMVIRAREFGSFSQNLKFEYILFRK